MNSSPKVPRLDLVIHKFHYGVWLYAVRQTAPSHRGGLRVPWDLLLLLILSVKEHLSNGKAFVEIVPDPHH